MMGAVKNLQGNMTSDRGNIQDNTTQGVGREITTATAIALIEVRLQIEIWGDSE